MSEVSVVWWRRIDHGLPRFGRATCCGDHGLAPCRTKVHSDRPVVRGGAQPPGGEGIGGVNGGGGRAQNPGKPAKRGALPVTAAPRTSLNSSPNTRAPAHEAGGRGQ